MNPFVAMCLWIYRRLAQAFPYEFQIVYGTDVVQLGADVADDVWKRHGFFGLVRLVADLAWRVPLEHLSEIRQDFFYAVRTIVKSPSLGIAAVLSLGMGIGVNTTAFSELNAFLFRDLPGARDPKKLVAIESPSSYPYYEHYRDQGKLFAGSAAYVPMIPFSVALEGAANAKSERIFGHLVSEDYFSVLGVRAARGRTFSSDTDKPGAALVVVVSDRFWRTRLDADPHAVGRTLRLNGRTATIVGIGPSNFLGIWPILPADLFVPLTVASSVAPELGDDVLHRRDQKIFRVVLRLNDGVSQATAEAALETMTRQLDQEGFDADRDQKGRRVRLLPGGGIVPIPRETLPVVLGFTATLGGLVLMIACMNLANMLLARAAARRREIAIRLAVGASRFRLVRQLLTESVLLAVCGGAAGLGLAYWLTDLFSTMKLPVQVPFEIDIRPDWHVLVFTFAISVIAGVGFGLAPALEATKADVSNSLKAGAMTKLRGFRRFGLRNLLVVYQVAGSLMLLLITGFLVLGFNKATQMDAGFDSNNLYLLALDPVRDGYSPAQAAALFEKLPDRVKQSGAVREVTLAEAPPFTDLNGGSQTFTAAGEPGELMQVLRRPAKEAIGIGYFATLNIPLLHGREFTARDQQTDPAKTSALPVVVNESAARALFGQADPLGRRISDASRSFEIVGVVRDMKTGFMSAGSSQNAGMGSMASSAAPVIYVPLTRQSFLRPPTGGMTVIVRAAAGADALEGVRREIASLDPNLTIFNVRTMQEHLDQMYSYYRIGTRVYMGLGLFALILASVGLAGVTAYSVAQRRKEIGIRMALGARRGQVMALVMREGAMLILAGSALGFLGAVALAKALSSFRNDFANALGIGVNEPILVIGAPLLLASLAIIACYLPARRSTRIDPLEALRTE